MVAERNARGPEDTRCRPQQAFARCHPSAALLDEDSKYKVYIRATLTHAHSLPASKASLLVLDSAVGVDPCAQRENMVIETLITLIDLCYSNSIAYSQRRGWHSRMLARSQHLMVA